MLEPKHNGILSANLEMLVNYVDDLKIDLILQFGILLLVLLCKWVLK